MPFQTLLYDTAEAIATITLNRPERLNTIVPPMPEELRGGGRARHDGPGGEGDRAARRRPRVLRGLRLRRAASTTGTRR